MFRYLRVWYKYWFKSRTNITIINRIPACEDCAHCKLMADEPWCNRPSGKFIENVDVFKGVITSTPDVIRHRCSYERQQVSDDMGCSFCGRDARFFKLKEKR